MTEHRFVYVTYIATTPEKLWQALTESAFTERYWSGTKIDSDWQIGSKVQLWMHDGRLGDVGVVLEFDPPRRLSYTWHVEFHEAFSREAPSRVTFEIEPLGDTVRLTVVHDDFEPGSGVLKAVSKGWPQILCSLKSLLEVGSPLEITSTKHVDAKRQAAVAEALAPAAEASEAGQQPSSVFVTYIAATPAAVWQALTDGDFTVQYFFGRRMQSDWKVGSPWKMTLVDGRTDSHGTVLESDPPRRLAMSWRVEWLEEYRKLPDAKVTYDLEQQGDVVRLTVSEFHHPSLDEKYKEGGRRGWPILLSGLKTLLETGHTLPKIPLPKPPST